MRQIQRTCTGPVTPQKQKRRRGKITTPEKARLKAWFKENIYNYYVPLYMLRIFIPEDLGQYGEKVLTKAVKDIDYISIIRP